MTRRADRGRLIVVPLVTLLLAADVWHLAHQAGHGITGLVGWLNAVLVCVFLAMVVWFYLQRRPAVATTPAISARFAAVIAAFVPFVFPLLPSSHPGAGRQLAGDVLLAAGAAWTVWALLFLGRNLSIIAQARAVADQGPYRWLRHPLYAGELISALGLALTLATAAAFALWLVLCGLQVYRAAREEQVLLQALPGYRDYRRRTAALLPGIF
jgi:protein-S-isoprenylcysteine O-methyltransferase Ste14